MAIACGTAVLLSLAGCESTIDAAKKIAARGTRAFLQQGISVTRIDRQIRVVSSAVVTDPSGTAAIVELRNTTRKPIVNAPIAINVLDASGHSVFRNNVPGAQFDLTHIPLLPPGKAIDWVNDQVLPSGKAARVVAQIGVGQTARQALPQLKISSVALVDDPETGYEASGEISNDSRVAQRTMVLFAVARQARRIVAGGRAILTRLGPGQRSPFHAYFIGDPRGAKITVTAPPSDEG
jgi:hypothetical protein